MNNLESENVIHTQKYIRGKLVFFKTYHDDKEEPTYRFDSFHQTWVLVCKGINDDFSTCSNIEHNNGYCTTHNNINFNNNNTNVKRFFKERIHSKYTLFYELNNKNYRYNENINEFLPVCIFNYKSSSSNLDTPFCSNFQIEQYGEFCARHKGNIEHGKKNSTEKGDTKENFITDLLLALDSYFLDVKNIGQQNSELDVLFRVKINNSLNENFLRGIQIKTLTKDRYKDIYYYNGRDLKKYHDDTLIVGVNDVFNKFTLFFKREHLATTTYFDFNNPKEIQKNNLFENLFDINSSGSDFVTSFVAKCKLSILYENSNISPSIKKEINSIERLKNMCLKNDLIFQYMNSSDSSFDCIINYKLIQCKYSEYKDCNLYEFNLKKIKNNLHIPYSVDDNIEFFIFENELNDFYIIPIKVLIYFGYITDVNNDGKSKILLCPTNTSNYHWSKYFINRFDLLKKNDLSELDNLSFLDGNKALNIFISNCNDLGIHCIRDVKNLSRNVCTIGDKIIKITKSANKKHYNYTFKFEYSKNIPYNISLNQIIPDYFALYIDGINEEKFFYIIPKNILIEQNVIGTMDKKGNIAFYLPHKNSLNIYHIKSWLLTYIDNFKILKPEIYSTKIKIISKSKSSDSINDFLPYELVRIYYLLFLTKII
jgi:hypothetical protein